MSLRRLGDGWGAIADPLESASLLSVEDRLVLTENSPVLDIGNKANIGLGNFQQFAQISGGGSVVIHPGTSFVRRIAASRDRAYGESLAFSMPDRLARASYLSFHSKSGARRSRCAR